jgi:hypothetical protein
MNAFEFMSEHPFLTVVLVFLLCCAAESIAKIIVTRGRGE